MTYSVHECVEEYSDEWYTPSSLVDAAREALGGIDLDPASCASANRVVRAERYYTEEDNGLQRPWSGRVWMNPPYSLTGLFVDRQISQYLSGRVDAGVLLVNASADVGWFQPLWDWPICFVKGRVQFYRPLTDALFNPAAGSVMVYLGPDPKAFRRAVALIGPVVHRVGNGDSLGTCAGCRRTSILTERDGCAHCGAER